MDKTIGILNFHFAKNYGAVMVPWAMQYILKHEFEQSSKVINYTFPTSQTDKYQYNSFDRFREDFLDITAYHCEITDSLYKYSDTFHTIIVGSDQVFRTSPEQPYYLKWVYGDVRCIAYAASFGINRFEGNLFSRRQAKKLLSRFDALSVRESSGVKILQETFGLASKQVLDPTLLLNAEDYQVIIDSDNHPVPENYVAVMFLDTTHWNELKNSELYKTLSLKYKFIDICKDEKGNFRPVPHWLNLIKNAHYVITDSFHGSVFSIIFRKQFITVSTVSRGNARIESLFHTLGIPFSRFYEKLSGSGATHKKKIIDYVPISKKIAEERINSLEFIRISLAMKPKKKDTIATKRGKLVLPILTIREVPEYKELLIFDILPVISKITKTGDLYLFTKISIKGISKYCRNILMTISSIHNNIFKKH